MSSTCTFELADYPIEEMKCYPIPELMVFFRERDRRVFVRKVCERNALVWWSLHGDDSEEQAFTYSIRICEFKSRLDLLGFTLEKTKSDFEESKLGEIERMTDANDRLRERITAIDPSRALQKMLVDLDTPDRIGRPKNSDVRASLGDHESCPVNFR